MQENISTSPPSRRGSCMTQFAPAIDWSIALQFLSAGICLCMMTLNVVDELCGSVRHGIPFASHQSYPPDPTNPASKNSNVHQNVTENCWWAVVQWWGVIRLQVIILPPPPIVQIKPVHIRMRMPLNVIGELCCSGRHVIQFVSHESFRPYPSNSAWKYWSEHEKVTKWYRRTELQW